MRFDNVMTKMFLALAVLAGCSFSVADAQQDWTQWRGPDLNTVADVNEEIASQPSTLFGSISRQVFA